MPVRRRPRHPKRIAQPKRGNIHRRRCHNRRLHRQRGLNLHRPRRRRRKHQLSYPRQPPPAKQAAYPVRHPHRPSPAPPPEAAATTPESARQSAQSTSSTATPRRCATATKPPRHKHAIQPNQPKRERACQSCCKSGPIAQTPVFIGSHPRPPVTRQPQVYLEYSCEPEGLHRPHARDTLNRDRINSAQGSSAPVPIG